MLSRICDFHIFASLCVLHWTLTCFVQSENVPLPLRLLSEKESVDRGAVCLDGSVPGYYASFANNSKTDTKWVIYFKGGGWCYDEDSCAKRARTELGGSSHFPSSFSFSGLLDSDALVNPTFHNFNRVILWYCDGASFTGNRSKPYFHKQTNQTLYFRGIRVLNALLDHLVDQHDLDKATEVLVSGGSAGGLAAYLHADFVGEYLRSKGAPLVKIKAAPVSGFFLMHSNVNGIMLYPNEMKYVFSMQNSHDGVNPKCLLSYAHNTSEQWRCIFANESYAHSDTPMFPLNSAVDAWQMSNIWDGDLNCARSNFKTCTINDIRDLNAYINDFVRTIKSSSKFSRNGEGGFLESCHEHCGMQNAYGFVNYTVGGITARAALTSWWEADSSEPATEHWYLPCELHSSAPHQCNPTC